MNQPRLLAALLCTLALLSGCTQQKRHEDRQTVEDQLLVLSYNIRHGEGTDGVLDLERTARVIIESGADLVALQEVDLNAERTGSVDQAAELGRLTGMHHAFAKFMDFQGGEYGLAVLSRYPIEDAQRIVIPAGEREPRSILAASVTTPAHGSLTFVSLHLDWLENDDDRYAQAVAITELLQDRDRVILAGDFNDVPGSRTVEHFIESGYQNAAKPDGEESTFSTSSPQREIDFVMYRPHGELAGTARVLDETVTSDHRPVLATFGPVR